MEELPLFFISVCKEMKQIPDLVQGIRIQE